MSANDDVGGSMKGITQCPTTGEPENSRPLREQVAVHSDIKKGKASHFDTNDNNVRQ